MDSIKCCIDCISCIMDNIPLEAGVQYTCINPKGKPHFTGQWDTPCMHFKEVTSQYVDTRTA